MTCRNIRTNTEHATLPTTGINNNDCYEIHLTGREVIELLTSPSAWLQRVLPIRSRMGTQATSPVPPVYSPRPRS